MSAKPSFAALRPTSPISATNWSLPWLTHSVMRALRPSGSRVRSSIRACRPSPIHGSERTKSGSTSEPSLVCAVTAAIATPTSVRSSMPIHSAGSTKAALSSSVISSALRVG